MLFKQATLVYSTGLEKDVPDAPMPARLPRGLFSYKLPFYCNVFSWDTLRSKIAQSQLPGKVILFQSKKKFTHLKKTKKCLPQRHQTQT